MKKLLDIVYVVLKVISWIWIVFWLLMGLVLRTTEGQPVLFSSAFIVLPIVLAVPITFLVWRFIADKQVRYQIKKEKVENNKEMERIESEYKKIEVEERLKAKEENKLFNSESLLEKNKDIPQFFIPLKYIKKKKRAIIVTMAIIGFIAIFINIRYLGIVRSVEIAGITVNKDSEDRNGRVNLDVNIKGLGNYFIEEAYVCKKEDWDKNNNTYVNAYDLTALTGKSIWFNNQKQEVHTKLNENLYSIVNKSTDEIEDEYVLVVQSRVNKVVSNTFTISKQMIDEILLAEQLQKEKSKEIAIQKEIEDKKAAEEVMAKQKEDDLLREQIEKNRYEKISDIDNTQTWRVYVESGKSLRIYGEAGGQLVIIISDESGDPLVSDMLWAGTYDKSYILNERYNGYYTVELSYISNYKYDWSFQVN